jgi:hypothetical protein
MRGEILAETTVCQWSACERKLPEFCVMFEGVGEQRLEDPAVVYRIWPVDLLPVRELRRVPVRLRAP